MPKPVSRTAPLSSLSCWEPPSHLCHCPLCWFDIWWPQGLMERAQLLHHSQLGFPYMPVFGTWPTSSNLSEPAVWPWVSVTCYGSIICGNTRPLPCLSGYDSWDMGVGQRRSLGERMENWKEGWWATSSGEANSGTHRQEQGWKSQECFMSEDQNPGRQIKNWYPIISMAKATILDKKTVCMLRIVQIIRESKGCKIICIYWLLHVPYLLHGALYRHCASYS